jgi:hypothetical protein
MATDNARSRSASQAHPQVWAGNLEVFGGRLGGKEDRALYEHASGVDPWLVVRAVGVLAAWEDHLVILLTRSNTLPMPKVLYRQLEPQWTELRRRIGEAKRSAAAEMGAPARAQSVTEQLCELAQLHRNGSLTDEELRTAKAQLLPDDPGFAMGTRPRTNNGGDRHERSTESHRNRRSRYLDVDAGVQLHQYQQRHGGGRKLMGV